MRFLSCEEEYRELPFGRSGIVQVGVQIAVQISLGDRKALSQDLPHLLLLDGLWLTVAITWDIYYVSLRFGGNKVVQVSGQVGYEGGGRGER
jgi:hypothetical protein